MVALVAFCIDATRNGPETLRQQRPALTTTKGHFAMATARICSIAGCGKPHKGHGYCSAHYTRWRRHGDPKAGGTGFGEPEAFLKNVVIPFIGDECLTWPYAKATNGHAQIYLDKVKKITARVVCEAVYGPPPTFEHEAAHNCGKGHLACVNPRHLRWATHQENIEDKYIHNTISRGETHYASKLTEAQVRKIKQLRGVATKKAIGEMFGVSRKYVEEIHYGKKWKHVR